MYAAVNALNELLAMRLPNALNDGLFQVVAGAVPRREYPEVLWEGMGVDTLSRVARRAVKHLGAVTDLSIDVERPFHRRRFRDRHAFFDAISGLWDKQACVFIVRVDWPKGQGSAHWTVLKCIEKDRVRLLDSGNQREIATARLGVRGDRGTRLHPPSTIMMTLRTVGGGSV